MVCGGCTGTVEEALKKCPGVTSVEVSLKKQTATVITTDDEIACKCSKDASGKCKCGADCQCMQRSLIAALSNAGFHASTSAPLDQCNCVCGPTCACGPNCTCTKQSTRMLQQLSLGIAVFTIAWMASKKYHSR